MFVVHAHPLSCCSKTISPLSLSLDARAQTCVCLYTHTHTHTQHVQALSVHNNLRRLGRGYSRLAVVSQLRHFQLLYHDQRDCCHIHVWCSLWLLTHSIAVLFLLSLSVPPFAHSLQATIIIDENPSSAQRHNSLPSSWICMFSIYSSTLYFRPLYTSWQHVQRRYQHICLISLSLSFASSDSLKKKKKKKANFSFIVQIYSFLSLSLSLSHSLGILLCHS